MVYLFANLFMIYIKYVSTHSNNACKTFPDYYDDLQNNPKCFYNPDVDLTMPEIIQRHGYTVENYTVTTQDGYILTVFRIPRGKDSSKQKPGPPVFIQHGLGCYSVIFVDTGRKSLAFVMADNGYDVWLGNFRGTMYSNSHVSLNSNDKKYWNFTFHELGIYDLPAQLDLVFNKTQQKSFYIGHSLGTTAYFVYNSEYPNRAKNRIRLAASMAPIAFLSHITSPYKLLTLPVIYNIVKVFLEDVTDGAINHVTPESIAATKLLCLPYPIQMHVCGFPLNLLYGFDPSQEDPTTLPVTTVQNKAAIGVKNVEHLAQLIQTGRFQQFDYGLKENKKNIRNSYTSSI